MTGLSGVRTPRLAGSFIGHFINNTKHYGQEGNQSIRRTNDHRTNN